MKGHPMDIITLALYLTAFLFGIVIGSFLNVCIYRIPEKRTAVTVPSHCMECGHRLGWYDLVPIFSYIFLRGRCRYCKAAISSQYPIIEGINGVLYVLIFAVNGIGVESGIYCLFTSALLVLSVIDWRTYEIPITINLFILTLGSIRVALDIRSFFDYLAGFFAVSVFLLMLYFVTKGRAIGGGDIKLMAAAGLLLGYKLVILAFFIGCILGSAIHLVRMRISGADKILAMGPYLSAGLFIAMLWGDSFIDWYISAL